MTAPYHLLILLNLGSSLADDILLFTLYPFSFLIYNHVAPEDLHERFNELSFLYNHDSVTVNRQLFWSIFLASTEKDLWAG